MKLAIFALASILLVACSDDESFGPTSGGDKEESKSLYKQFKDRPCNSSREGREVIVGKNTRYTCMYDDYLWEYVWVSDDDTLTAEGRPLRQSSSSRAYSSSSSYYRSSSSSYYRSSSSSYNTSYSQVARSYLLSYKGQQFNPNINYGTLRDRRDGKTYATVRIGDQVWMAENLNYEGNAFGEAVCIYHDQDLCDLYGRLYTRDAAYDNLNCAYGSSCSPDTHLQGLCPDGWHIPTMEETQELFNTTGTNPSRLMAVDGWEDGHTSICSRTDDFGLSLIGTANFCPDEHPNFKYFHISAQFWINASGRSQQYLVTLAENNSYFFHTFSSYVVYNAVRCLQD